MYLTEGIFCILCNTADLELWHCFLFSSTVTWNAYFQHALHYHLLDSAAGIALSLQSGCLKMLLNQEGCIPHAAGRREVTSNNDPI